MPMLDVKGGAQERRAKGGMQQISVRLATRIQESGGRCVLSAPVRAIVSRESGTTPASGGDQVTTFARGGLSSASARPVLVSTDAGDFEASFVISTVPLPQVRRISFQPALPLIRRRAVERMHVGNYTKVGRLVRAPCLGRCIGCCCCCCCCCCRCCCSVVVP